MKSPEEKKYTKCTECLKRITTHRSRVKGLCGLCASKKRRRVIKGNSKIVKGIINIVRSDQHNTYTSKELLIRLRFRNVTTNTSYLNYLLNKKLDWLLVKEKIGSGKVVWKLK